MAKEVCILHGKSSNTRFQNHHMACLYEYGIITSNNKTTTVRVRYCCKAECQGQSRTVALPLALRQ
eukprot:scaffold118123_cov10-Prasinocladus_malaysianus.AAC.1